MNTIQNTPKELFKSKEQYLQFIQAWKKAYKENKQSLTLKQHMLYAMFRNKDWRKCCTPCTNKNKINNGQKPNQTTFTAFFELRRNYRSLCVFGENVTNEMYDNLISKYLPDPKEFNLGDSIPNSPYKVINETVCSGS